MKQLLKIILFLLVFTYSFYAQSSNNIILKGSVIDSVSGQPLSLVNIFPANTTLGCASDKNGNYIIKNIPQGIYDIIFSCIGYKLEIFTYRTYLSPNFVATLNVKLKPKQYNLEEVVIKGDKILI